MAASPGRSLDSAAGFRLIIVPYCRLAKAALLAVAFLRKTFDFDMPTLRSWNSRRMASSHSHERAREEEG